jgi:hypothetical protein
MKNTFFKSGRNIPGSILIISGILLFLVSYFLGSRTVDLHFYDTYYVLPMRPVFFAHSILLFVMGSVMNLFENNRFFRMLSIAGAAITFLSTAGACYALWKSYLLFSYRPQRYTDVTDNFAQINMLYLTCIAIIIAVQIGFILISLYRLIRGKGNDTIEKLPLH